MEHEHILDLASDYLQNQLDIRIWPSVDRFYKVHLVRKYFDRMDFGSCYRSKLNYQSNPYHRGSQYYTLLVGMLVHRGTVNGWSI